MLSFIALGREFVSFVAVIAQHHAHGFESADNFLERHLAGFYGLSWPGIFDFAITACEQRYGRQGKQRDFQHRGHGGPLAVLD